MPPAIEQLKTDHRYLGEQHSCCVYAEDYAELESTLTDLTLSSQLTHTSLSVYDLHSRDFLLPRDLASNAIHHPVFFWQAGYTDDHYHDTIHPDDLPYVLEGHIEAYDLLENTPPHEKRWKTLCSLFRVRNGRGGYRLIFYRMAVLRLDHRDKPWLLLIHSTLLTDCAGKEVPRGYCLGTISKNDRKMVLTCTKTSVNLLSERECEVLSLVIAGYENHQIAEMLNISEYTVSDHRRHIQHHLWVKDMPQAVVFALRMGLV